MYVVHALFLLIVRNYFAFSNRSVLNSIVETITNFTIMLLHYASNTINTVELS